ncbi:MAG: serine/threonine protein kinase [Ruminococcus sp.]
MSTFSYQLKPGTVLDERYRIEETIGEGGFGITYLGINVHQGEKVAIKEFFWKSFMGRNTRGTSEVFLSREEDRKDYEHQKKRFLREARIIREFAGEPGIVQVKDYFEENGTAYIVMEFLEGRTLKQYMKDGQPLEAEQAFRMLLPLMETLKKIHSYGMIHRDISPDNIMVGEDGTLTLIDFGAARDFWKLAEESRSVILKGGYAACEQYDRHGRLGPWTDIYGLCAVLYFCITGNAPEDAFQRMLHDELATPKELGIRIEPGLEKILLKGLSVDISSRYQNMEVFIAEVWEHVRERDPKEIRKRWMIRGGILTVCFCAAFGIGFWYYQSHLEQFKFRDTDTLHLTFSRPDSITDEAYEKLLETFEKRTEIIAGENNHIIETDEDEFRAVIPSEPYKDMIEKDVSGLVDTEELLALTLAASGRVSLDKFELSSENVERAEIKRGQVEGYVSEYITGDDYYYLELKVTDTLARQLESIDEGRETPGIHLYMDRSWSGEMGMTGVMDHASMVYDTEDYSTFYLICYVQDPVFYETIRYDITHAPYEKKISGAFLPPATWEEADASLLAGEYQVNEEKISDPAFYVTYLPGVSDQDMPKGQWHNTVSDFKTMLDTLEIPYAFGVSKIREHDIIIKISKENLYLELMDMLTEKNLEVSGQKGKRYHYFNAGYNDNFEMQEEKEPYLWKMHFISEYEQEDLYEETQEALQENGSSTLYFKAGDYILAKTLLTDPVDKGIFRFSDINLANGRLSGETLYRFAHALIFEITNSSSYTLGGLTLTDENGNFQTDENMMPYRVLKREQMEEVRKAAKELDENIQVEDSLDMRSLFLSFPKREEEDYAVYVAQTAEKLFEQCGLLDGEIPYVRVYIEDETLKGGEKLRFDFFLTDDESLMVEVGESWREAYQPRLEAYFERDEFYRQFMETDNLTFYEN